MLRHVALVVLPAEVVVKHALANVVGHAGRAATSSLECAAKATGFENTSAAPLCWNWSESIAGLPEYGDETDCTTSSP